MEYANLAARMADDTAFAVRKLRGFGDEHFRHAVRLQSACRQ